MATTQLAYIRDPATGQVSFDASGFPLFDANTGANTYGQLQARVADEVLGSPTAAQIQNAIQDAIDTYSSQTFWFNNIRYFGGVAGSASDLVTAVGKEFYSAQDLPVLVNMPHISKILVLAFNNRYPMTNRTPQWIDDHSIGPSWNGLPTDWAFQSGAVRLYPIPFGIFPLIIDATIRFAPLVNDTDYNCWTNEAGALIRLEAKRNLFSNITRNPLQVQAMDREIYGDASIGRQGALAILRRESTRRSGGPGKIRASRGYL